MEKRGVNLTEPQSREEDDLEVVRGKCPKSKSEFLCEACQFSAKSKVGWMSHLRGKKHLAASKSAGAAGQSKMNTKRKVEVRDTRKRNSSDWDSPSLKKTQKVDGPNVKKSTFRPVTSGKKSDSRGESPSTVRGGTSMEIDNVIISANFGGASPAAKVLSVSGMSKSEVDQRVSELLKTRTQSGDGRSYCRACSFSSRNTGHTKEHIQRHIEGLSFPCQLCNLTFRYKMGYNVCCRLMIFFFQHKSTSAEAPKTSPVRFKQEN